MLSTLRVVLSVVVCALLAVLYAASQSGPVQSIRAEDSAGRVAAAQAAHDYALWIDAPWMRLLAAAIFLAAIALAFIRDRENGESAT